MWCSPLFPLKVIFIVIIYPELKISHYHSQAPVKSEAKAVQTTKHKAVQRPQPVNQHFVASQTRGPVGLALDVSFKSKA